MTQRTGYFLLAHSLIGCYMPDSVTPIKVHTRRELMDIIRSEMEHARVPQYRITEFEIKKVWRWTQRHDSSQVHSAIETHKGYQMELIGLTESEYKEHAKELDF